MRFARPLMLAFAVAVTLPCLPARADAPADMQRRLEEPSGIVKLGDRPVDVTALRDFYRLRNWRLAWGEGRAERLNADMQALAAAEGMSPELYAIPAAAAEAERDILVSDALARLGHDLTAGRVSPSRTVGGMGPETRQAFDSTKFLTTMAAAQDIAPAAEALPAYAGYWRLRASLRRYEQLVQAGGWTQIPDGPSIKPGMESDRVPLVRKRLIATGELEAKYDKGKHLDAPLSAGLKRFQVRHGIEPDGAVGKQTLAALNVPAEERLRQISLNLERWRWMPRSLDANHVAVNLPAAHLELVRNGEIQMAMRVVVGDVEHQTPGMMTTMHSVVLNPTWTVPPNIANKEILPKLRKDPNYLTANNMRILDAFPEDSPKAAGVGMDWRHLGNKFPYRLRQKPGPENALGQVKFNLSNTDDIYLHDTPKRQYFGRIFRALSHGCVRVERPVDLAEAVLGGDWKGRVDDAIAETNTRTVKLDHPLTVYLMYMTAWTDEDGTVNFRDDLYGHDGRLKAALKRPRALAPQVAREGQ